MMFDRAIDVTLSRPRKKLARARPSAPCAAEGYVHIGGRLMFEQTGRSILSQTFWLLVGALIVIDAISLTSFFMLPPPRQEGVALMQIAEKLENENSKPRRSAMDLQVIHQAALPRGEQGSGYRCVG